MICPLFAGSKLKAYRIHRIFYQKGTLHETKIEQSCLDTQKVWVLVFIL